MTMLAKGLRDKEREGEKVALMTILAKGLREKEREEEEWY